MIQLKGGYLIWQKIQKRSSLKKLKNRNNLHNNWTNLQIFITAFYLRTYGILTVIESDMKEDILSVSELPAHTTSSEIFKVLSGFTEERDHYWRNCAGVCIDSAACLPGRNSGLVTKIKEMAGNNLLLTHCYIHRQNLASKKIAPELTEVLSY